MDMQNHKKLSIVSEVCFHRTIAYFTVKLSFIAHNSSLSKFNNLDGLII